MNRLTDIDNLCKYNTYFRQKNYMGDRTKNINKIMYDFFQGVHLHL